MRIAGPSRASRPPSFEWPAADAGADVPARGRARGLLVVAFVVAVAVAAAVGAAATVVVDRSLRWPSEVVVERYGTNARPITGGATDVQALLYAVEPAVVTIDVLKPATGSDGVDRTIESHGTGIVVSSTGRVVTCRHVVSGALSISVTVHGSRTALPATVVAEDANQDLALIEMKGARHLPTVAFGDSGQVEVGDDVVVIGNALALPGEPSVTRGMISAVGRDLTVPRDDGGWPPTYRTGLLQTNASVNPGDSGGPLVDSAARVIGMTTMKADTLDGADAHGVSFATPSNVIERFVERHAG